MKIHNCLETQGQTNDCQNCSISQAGHLDEFLKLLEKQTNMFKSIRMLEDYEREDIISESVWQVHNKINQFRGISKDGRLTKFSTWAHFIFKGVYVDHLRKKLGRPQKTKINQSDREALCVNEGDTRAP